jgi:hypothetical protein
VDDLLAEALAALLLGTILLGPAVFLFLGWRCHRAGRYGRADTFTTIAGVGSWILLGIEGLLVPYAVLQGVPLWGDPGGMLLISYPPAVWFFARTLTASIARRRTQDRIETRVRREEEREREDGRGR